MLVKSPMKKEKVRKNKPDKTSTKKKSSAKNKVYGERFKQKEEKKKRISLPKVKPWKVVVGALIIGAFGFLYLSHVFATQQLLREVQQLERDYNRAKRMHSDYRLAYDRMIGPAEIYEKAKGQGLINGGPAERVIEVEK